MVESIVLIAHKTLPRRFESRAEQQQQQQGKASPLVRILFSNFAQEGFSQLQTEGAEGLILSCWVVPPPTNNPIENRGTICGVICLSGKVGVVGYGPN